MQIPGLGFEVLPVVFSSFRFHPADLFQMSDSLSGSINLITFGETAGRVELQGVGHRNMCQDDSTPNISAIDAVIDLWNSNKITARQVPFRIVIGDRQTLNVLLTDFDVTSNDTDNRSFQFRMSMASIPFQIIADRLRIAEAGAPAGTLSGSLTVDGVVYGSPESSPATLAAGGGRLSVFPSAAASVTGDLPASAESYGDYLGYEYSLPRLRRATVRGFTLDV